MVMSRDQNAGRSHNMRIDNRSFERVEELKYLGTIYIYICVCVCMCVCVCVCVCVIQRGTQYLMINFIRNFR
jgi:tellurite resistance protein TehA-like permease